MPPRPPAPGPVSCRPPKPMSWCPPAPRVIDPAGTQIPHRPAGSRKGSFLDGWMLYRSPRRRPPSPQGGRRGAGRPPSARSRRRTPSTWRPAGAPSPSGCAPPGPATWPGAPPPTRRRRRWIRLLPSLAPPPCLACTSLPELQGLLPHVLRLGKPSNEISCFFMVFFQNGLTPPHFWNF